MRVLIVKTSSMGDVLHTLPALTDAQQAIPGIKFDWVVEEGFAQIPSWHAAVERVIPVAIRRWRKAWFSAPIKAERKAFREALQVENYDAVDLNGDGVISYVMFKGQEGNAEAIARTEFGVSDANTVLEAAG